MKVVRDNAWDLFRAYALIDAEVSALYFERLTQLFRGTTGSGLIPSALSNIGVKLLQTEWMDRDPPGDRLKFIGKERVKEQVWNDATGNFNTLTEEPYIEEASWHIDFATECYHGGRSEQLWFGPSEQDHWSDFDLASAYPTAMAMLTVPEWTNIRPTRDENKLRLGSFGFACVDFKFPNEVRYPSLPVRTGHGILFPQQGRSYCCSPEIEVALNLGAEIIIKYALTIPTGDEKIFFPFIQQSIERRAKAAPGLEQAFWKEVTNSCYGKTAQGLRNKRVFNLKTKKTRAIPESPITNPFYAAYITSAVRAVVGEIINLVPQGRSIFSVTTDGFLTNTSDDEMEDAIKGPLAQLFSNTRSRLTGDPQLLTKKHSVKRLLGWRVRGQATIEPDTEAGDKGVVLAKAGIKTPTYTTTDAEQNDYIVDQFLQRIAGRKFPTETPTSWREISLFNADLVMKRGEKAISMEYDFKRRPAQAWDVQLEYTGKAYTHLAFSTAPWRTAEEFKLARQMWEDYSRVKIKFKASDSTGGFRLVKRQRHCLKTTKDFRRFAAFHDMKIAVKGKGRSYLRSDLSRLRLDLCTAYQQGAAGLEGCREQYTAQQFADILNQCGFEEEVTRPHVEYGVRREFTAHTTPPTTKVLRALRRLSKAIPSLRPQEILASLDGLPLLLTALEPQ